MIRTRVTGAAQLERRMRKLSAAAQHRVLREAVEAGSEPIVRSAKGRAPSADIAEGVRLINVLRKARAVVAEIGLPGGRRKWFHGLFIELGTGPRVQKATGRRTGSMPARPFLRPAFNAERKNAQNAFWRVLKMSIERAARG